MVAIETLGPQTATFHVDVAGERKVVSITVRDAAALVAILEARDTANTAAAKIARATRLHEGDDVDLKIGEDEEVLAALDELRAERGQLGQALTRLEKALVAKIQASS